MSSSIMHSYIKLLASFPYFNFWIRNKEWYNQIRILLHKLIKVNKNEVKNIKSKRKCSIAGNIWIDIWFEENRDCEIIKYLTMNAIFDLSFR